MRIATLAFGLSVLLLPSAASAAVTNYKVHLASGSGLPSIPIPGFDGGLPGFPGGGGGDGGAGAGDGTFTYDDATKKLTGTVTHTVSKANTSKLAVPASTPGGKVRTIGDFAGPSPIAVTATLTAEDETDLTKGNVHFGVSDGQTQVEGKLEPDTGDGSSDAGAPGSGQNGGGSNGGGSNNNGSSGTSGGTKASDGGSETDDSAAPEGDTGGCSATPTSASMTGVGSAAFLLGALLVARGRRRDRSRPDRSAAE